MRHLFPARPGAALVAACLMTTTPFASSQAPATAAPAATPAAPATSTIVPGGAQAVALQSTPEALSAELVGKTFFLRGFYQDDKLQFATDGKVMGSPQRGSFALSALEIDKVKFTKHSIQIQAHRIGLHFFGALPYEDDTKPFERIKVDPKKSMNIEVERLVIEPEKKKKKKDNEKKDEQQIAAKSDAAKSGTPGQATTTAANAQPAVENKDAQQNAAKTAAPTSGTPGQATTTAANTEPAVAPNHDPRVSFLQLSKALNVMFAPALDDSVIATVPEYWQNYFATKEGKARAQRVDASTLRPGGDVKPPQLLTIIDPASNEYAQKNNIAGMIFIQAVVDANGHPGSVTIVRPIGFGLDERAVDAVQHAQFRPGTLNGKPVPVLVNLQVTFRIYSNRTRPTKMQPGGTPTQMAPRDNRPPSNAPVLASTDKVSE